MRIRATKPEFWRSKTIATLPWRLVYDGPMPKRLRDVAPEGSGYEYVYFLFDGTDRLLYVGRSWRPATRFTGHYRRDWWPRVSRIALIAVEDEIRFGVHRMYYTPPNVAAFESAAIAELDPIHNIAGRTRVAS
ncbi:G-I-Y Y-I-G endonuclease [Gordonia phage Sahara]|nr:endonuclease [Gordonia phage Sahara]QSM00107.1 hypothetical protein SEA_CASHLINE_68 [Gordonia phage Cashline]QYW00791.1 G-I-Y Y-I-G endonuclease [Gordonia phage Sahara]